MTDDPRAEFDTETAAYDREVLAHPIPAQSTISSLIEGFHTITGKLAQIAGAGSTAKALSLRQALVGLDAARDILVKVAHGADDAALKQYQKQMNALRDERIATANALLAANAGQYAPFTAKFRQSAQDIRATIAKAKQSAAALGVTADLLTAAGNLMAVV